VLCLGLPEKKNEENYIVTELTEYNSESENLLFVISVAQCLEF
jgi:hypothetical protein